MSRGDEVTSGARLTIEEQLRLLFVRCKLLGFSVTFLPQREEKSAQIRAPRGYIYTEQLPSRFKYAEQLPSRFKYVHYESIFSLFPKIVSIDITDERALCLALIKIGAAEPSEEDDGRSART